MKRMNAIAAVGAAILAIGAYLAGSGLLVPSSSEVAAVVGASPTAAPSPTSPSSQAADIETILAEFGVFAPTSSDIAAATGAPSSRPMSSAAGTALVAQAATLETVALKVDGLWCPSCAYFVHQALMRPVGLACACHREWIGLTWGQIFCWIVGNGFQGTLGRLLCLMK